MENAGNEAHFGYAVSLSIEGLKSLFLLNGGAATAMIAITDRTPGSPNYAMPTIYFGGAAFLAVLTFAVGYFSQLSYANHRFNHGNGQASAADLEFRRHNALQNIAIMLVSVSLVLSGCGMYQAFRIASREHQSINCSTAGAFAKPPARATGRTKPH